MLGLGAMDEPSSSSRIIVDKALDGERVADGKGAQRTPQPQESPRSDASFSHMASSSSNAQHQSIIVDVRVTEEPFQAAHRRHPGL
jgi:hypothetical protein